MKTYSTLSLYLRILLVVIFIALLGLSPTPYTVEKYLIDSQRFLADGDMLNAAKNLADAALYYPWRVELNITAAQYAFQAGNPKLAIQYLERPGTISHLTGDELVLLGDAYFQSGNSTKAVAIWTRVLELGNSIPACQRLVDFYLQKMDYSSATNYLQRLLTLDPTNVQLYYQIGVVYAVTEPAKALPFLAQAAQLDSAEASHAIALHDKIRTASLFDEPAYTLLIVGRQLADWGKWQWASTAFQQAVIIKPNYADAWAFLGEAKQQTFTQETGRISDLGLPELEHAIQLASSSVLVNTLMGVYWERHGDYTTAEQYVKNAIIANPKDPYLYSELGNILSKAGDLPAAQAAYQHAINLTPQDPVFYRQLAQFAMDNQIQIRELALPAARQAISLDPYDASSLDVMAQIMLMLFDYQSAARFSTSAIQSDPGFAPAYLHLGTAYLYQGKSSLARYWLGLAEKVDQNSWVTAQATRLLDYYLP